MQQHISTQKEMLIQDLQIRVQNPYQHLKQSSNNAGSSSSCKNSQRHKPHTSIQRESFYPNLNIHPPTTQYNKMQEIILVNSYRDSNSLGSIAKIKSDQDIQEIDPYQQSHQSLRGSKEEPGNVSNPPPASMTEIKNAEFARKKIRKNRYK